MEPSDYSPSELAIRPPTQQRSREGWRRVLDAGVALLEDEGYDAFTISAVCERARVAPPAIYARAANKDALYLAVYEHGMQRILHDQASLAQSNRWSSSSAEELVRGIVGEITRLFFTHARLLRSVVRTSSVHPEVLRRGEEYSRLLGSQFVERVLDRRDAFTSPDPVGAAWQCFNVVFATCAMRISNGPQFAAEAVEDARFAAQLADVAVAYLLSGSPAGTGRSIR